MNDADWTRNLDALSPWQRRFAQLIMARVGYILNQDRIITIEDVQGLEDRQENQQRQMRAEETRQDDADARMDAIELADEQRDDRLDELEHPHEA